jgi:enamine deaminase RidA (YjgF/YER057c/UK114 family)
MDFQPLPYPSRQSGSFRHQRHPDLRDIVSDVNGNMERTPINPVSWSIELGFDQAELIEGHQRLLVCSAQDAMDADGNPQHPDDLAAQLELSLDNLEAVLAAADMTLANVVRLNFYATDITSCSSNSQELTSASGTRAMRRPCSASGNYQHGSSSCWRQPPLTEPRHLSRDVRERRFGGAMDKGVAACDQRVT